MIVKNWYTLTYLVFALLVPFKAILAQEIPPERTKKLDAIRADISAQFAPRIVFDQLDDKAGIIAELKNRFELEQWIRRQLSKPLDCTEGQSDYFCDKDFLFSQMRIIDEDNLPFVEAFLEKHDWPTASDWSEDTPKYIWFMIQHSNAELMAKVLPEVKAALDRGELGPWHYAAMYDRIENFNDRPQRYGTQFRCVGGSYDYINMLEPENLAERRAEIGFAPQSELFGKRC